MDRFFKNSQLVKSALLIYWVVLTFLLLKPSHLEEQSWYLFDGIDKVIHVSVFIMLGFLFMTAFKGTIFWTFIQIMLLYAFLTEIFQEMMHMGRSMEVLDIVADSIGIFLGYYIYKVYVKNFL